MALRKIGQFEANGKKAVVYRDAEWEEYRVKFWVDFNGSPVYQVDADYHTDDKVDAMDTAESIVNKPQKVGV